MASSIKAMNIEATEAVSTAQRASYPGLPTFTTGLGCWLIDGDGRRYFDATGGSGAVGLGHNHPRIVAAAERQIHRLVHTGSMFHSDMRDQLVALLGRFSPYERSAILLAVTGTSAIEAALKVARAATQRRLVFAFDYAFHGKSTGALAVSWRDHYKRYAPLPDRAVMRAPYPLLHSAKGEHQPAACLERIEALVEDAARLGDPPAAFILEPIACTEGVLPAGVTFLERLIEIAHGCGALVIFDEIYTGFGRCGSRFIAERVGLRPDILVVGKSLGNGFPISAVLGHPDIMNTLPTGIHTTTFAGHPVASAVACEVIEVMEQDMPWIMARAAGLRLAAALQELATTAWFIANPRGEGLMLGFDCIAYDGTAAPQIAEAFATMALDRGLILHYGGFEGCTIKLTPPLTINEEDLSFLVDTLVEVTDEMLIAML
jgi:4-aminobutyrate aminotransferase-like enzyme